MADRSVCTPLSVESDASNCTFRSPNANSFPDADKVINTKSDSTQVKGDMNEEALLKGLFTDTYCHLCEAELCFESQRVSHYEGKKHAQRLKVYLQAKRAEMNRDSKDPQWSMSTGKDRFCELCNMVFSSSVVAKSHYEGKVHSKNLRKQGLHLPEKRSEAHTLPNVTQDPDSDLKILPEAAAGHPTDPAAPTIPPLSEVDLKDRNKYCALCAAVFNNPQMALQHYNGRRHQRKQARQELLKELGDDAHQANSLKCRMCSLQFNSVEMYQAHMAGNKHQIREKKVVDLCNSQQKVYSTFADELADYIEVQKARGVTLKTSDGGAVLKEDEDVEEERQGFDEGDVRGLNIPVGAPPPASHPPLQSHPGCYYPARMWQPAYQGPPWPTHGWEHRYPPPLLSSASSPRFRTRPAKRKKFTNDSSSSSYTTSSYSSDSSSSSSESDDSEKRRREKRKIIRSRRERGRGKRRMGSEKEERIRKHRKREREQSVESDEERRKKPKHRGKHRRKENKFQEENLEVERPQREMDKLKPEDTEESRRETEVHIQTEADVGQREGGQDEPSKAKCRRDKKKTKEKTDTRTEEEKLWDDSILGC
ncbi:zinc finger matrin-type protein 1 [Salarias fasciatus]|nr:zinc finger matrin-type protein 1-like [Salarias fasciatus]